MGSLQFTRPVIDNPFLRAEAGPTLPTSGFTAAGAAFSMPFTTALLRKQAEVLLAEEGPLLGLRSPTTGQFIPAVDGKIPLGARPPFGEFERVRGEFEGRVFSAEQLNERYHELGLQFTRPMGADAAEIMANSKRAQLIRDNIIARGPSGVIPFTVQLGAALLASAFDPIEVASVFVPIVGQARAAGIIARIGRVRGRALVGAAEGLGGNILLEPAFAGLSRQLQLDYEFTDSIMNVALGGLLGAGIGAAIGGVGRITAARRRKQVRALVDELAGLDLAAPKVAEAELVTIRSDITARRGVMKELKRTVKERTKALNILRKEGRLEDPDVQPERQRLAEERTAAESTLTITRREIKDLQKQEKERAPVAEPTAKETAAATAEADPVVVGDAFRAAVAQVAQGKSVDVSAIVDPGKRQLLKEIKEKVAEVRQLQRAEATALKETQALPQDTIERQAASEKRAAIALERLQAQQDVTALKRQAAELDATAAAHVAETEPRPSRDGLNRPESQQEAEVVLAADETITDDLVADLQVEVKRLADLEDLDDLEIAAVEKLLELDKKVSATGRILKSLKNCFVR